MVPRALTLLEAITRQFELLNHYSPSELVALGLTREKSVYLDQGWAKTPEEALAWVEMIEWDNPTASLYIGVSDRKAGITGRSTRENIEAVSCIVLDIDPIRERGSKQMATDDERRQAAWAATLINAHLAESGFHAGSWLDSGNGIALYLPIERILVEDEPEIDRKIAAFVETLRPVISGCKAKIDSTYDLPRLTRLAGTFNRKGLDQSLWRQSAWL